VGSVLAAMAGDPLTPQQKDAAAQPTTHGGCGLALAEEEAPLAYLATMVSIIPTVIAANGGDEQRTLHDAMDRCGLLGAAAGAQESIEQRGVYLDVYGMPKATRPDKALDTHTFGGTPLTHRKRGWVQALASAAAARVADADARLHYASGGGEEGGAGFLANQSFRVQPWDDAEFMTCLRWRLRMDVVPEGRCQHQRVTGDGAGKPCGHILDPHGRHAVSCMVGGARDALHGACCEVLHRAHKDAGLQCRREVHIPELATDRLKEPRADLDAWGMPGQGHARLDFTAVAQWAARHSRAEPAPGAAAATAEKEKFTKYGSRGGVHVQGLAMELGGRCGPALEA